MRDAVAVIALLLAFATFVTTHIAIAVRLTWIGRPRWRGPVALVVAPLAPIWALRAGWRRSAAIWVGSLAIYAITLVLART